MSVCDGHDALLQIEALVLDALLQHINALLTLTTANQLAHLHGRVVSTHVEASKEYKMNYKKTSKQRQRHKTNEVSNNKNKTPEDEAQDERTKADQEDACESIEWALWRPRRETKGHVPGKQGGGIGGGRTPGTRTSIAATVLPSSLSRM